MACINNIKIKKVFDKPPGFISFIVDVSDYKSINNLIIQISNDWITNVNDKSIFLKWGDLDSIGCELEIDSKNIAINLDIFSCFPIYYLKKDNIFLLLVFGQILIQKKI